MKTANAIFENHHVNALFSFHTETILYQKSDFRAIGGIYVFGKKPKFHIIGILCWIKVCLRKMRIAVVVSIPMDSKKAAPPFGKLPENRSEKPLRGLSEKQKYKYFLHQEEADLPSDCRGTPRLKHHYRISN